MRQKFSTSKSKRTGRTLMLTLSYRPLALVFILLSAMVAIAQTENSKLPPEEKQLAKQAGDMAMDSRFLAENDKYDEAIAKANSALAILDKSRFPLERDIWWERHMIFLDLGVCYYAKGEYKLAEDYLLRARKLLEDDWARRGQTPWTEYIEPARFALIYQALGDSDKAFENFVKADEIYGRNLAGAFNLYTERARIQSVTAAWPMSNWIISFSMQQGKKKPAAGSLAFLTALRRKSRIATSMANWFHLFRQSDFDKKVQTHVQAMNQYFAANSDLSSFYLRNSLQVAQAQYKQQEAQYRKTSAPFDELFDIKNIGPLLSLLPEAKPETLQSIRDALPADAAMIEFIIYTPFNFRARENSQRWGEPRYAAFVLRSGSTDAEAYDLGTTGEINSAIANLRAALSYPSGDVRELAREVDAKLMQPLRGVLGDTRTIFIAPDGQLNVVPFGALVDERGKYLVEQYSISYLTSARDLLSLAEKNQSTESTSSAPADRTQSRLPNRQGPVIVGDPDFSSQATGSPPKNCSELKASLPSEEAKEETGGRVATRLKAANPSPKKPVGQFSFQFDQIPFTRVETSGICSYLPGTTLYIGQGATEENLKTVSGPSILHIATHGYFIADAPPAEKWIDGEYHYRLQRNPWNDIRWDINPPEDPTLLEHPLLRSGLALVGANRLASSGGQDGIITALEVMGLDLWGTRLVVLSACHTGVGDVQDGEGVFGLRRALLIAGAESQVISLWAVEDRGTSNLMVDYYRRLSNGEGRSEALRTAQLAILQGSDEELRHPYYWAGFIQSGAWTGISLGRPAN